MTFKAFLIGLLASFGLPWLVAVIIPFASMGDLDPVEMDDEESINTYYSVKRDGRTDGSIIYGQEGCYQCHTQLIRPTYAGQDVHRDGWAGLMLTADSPDTRRETLAMDYEGEHTAYTGISRVGPDLSNLGRRLEFHLAGRDETPVEWVLRHLYNPRDCKNYREDSQDLPENSTCPAKLGMFEKVPAYRGRGEGLDVQIDSDEAIVPTDRARALADYLVSLKRDTLNNPLPKEIDYNPKAPAAE